MWKYLFLAGVFACLLSPAQARQRHATSGCVETGSTMFPVCGMGQPVQTPHEARRIARGQAAVRALGFGAVRVNPRPARHYDSPVQTVSRVAAIGSGIVRSVSGATARVAASATGAFQCFVDKLDAQGYPIRFLGGWRAHGSVPGSLHPAGLAMDVNQIARNVTTPRMPSNEVALANSCGLVSGASWGNSDSGHAQLGGWAGSGRHYAGHHRVHYASRHRRHYASAR